MAWIIGFLTFVLLLNCFLLVLLVLIQLPKKEAGLGTAFGGAATDALFGAGSGNALTKMTKVSCTVFFVLTMLLSVLNAAYNRADSPLDKALSGTAPTPELPLDLPVTTPPAAPVPVDTNLSTVTNMIGTNLTTTPAPVEVEPPVAEDAPAPPVPPDNN